MQVALAVRRLVASRKPILAGTLLALHLGMAVDASAQLVNPAFDSGPAGPVGNFGLVVGPPFQDGFWGAENASIVASTTCGTAPLSNPYMLQVNVGGDVVSQFWQVVDVTGGPPVQASLTAWGNTCATGANPVMGVEIRTYNSVNGWPSHTSLTSNTKALDTDSGTWESVIVECAVIPPDTEWIMAHIYFVNASMGGVPGYVDDVDLNLGECIVPVEPTTWGGIKATMRSE